MHTQLRSNVTHRAMRLIAIVFFITISTSSVPAFAQVTWVEAIKGNSADRGRDIAVDGAGNTYVTGFFSDSPDFDDDGQANATSSGDYDVFLAKYDASGTFQWVTTAGGGIGRDRGVSIALDDAGFLYITGYFSGEADFTGDGQADVTAAGGTNDEDIYVAKYDGMGTLQWVRSAGSSFAPESGKGIAVTSTGDVFVSGNISGDADFDGDGQSDVTAPGAGDIFLAKYNGAGTLQWVQAAGGFLIDEGLGVDVDDSGNSYVTGVIFGSADFDGDGQSDVSAGSGFAQNAFVAKYDNSGGLLWVNAAGSSQTSRGEDIAVSGAGVSVITGSFQGSADFDGDGQSDVTSIGSADIFVSKYDATGALQWVRGAGGTEFDTGFGISINDAGVTYVTGGYQGSTSLPGADFDGDGLADVAFDEGVDIFVAKYEASGRLGGVQGAIGAFDDRGYAIDTDDAGNAYVTGNFNLDVDFSGDGQADVTSASGADGFVARYDASVLPVELAGFSGRRIGETVGLVWQTLSETNNTGFAVERRIDDGVWSRIGFVEGAGTTTRLQRYRFTDPSIPYDASSLTYRLRQIDVDGTATIAGKETVTVGTPDGLELPGTYPNPAREQMTVRVGIPQGMTDARLVLFDVLGRQMREVPVQRSGRQAMQLRTGDLAPGIYFLRLTGGGQVRTQKLSIVR